MTSFDYITNFKLLIQKYCEQTTNFLSSSNIISPKILFIVQNKTFLSKIVEVVAVKHLEKFSNI